MLAVLNRNSTLTTSAPTIADSRALLMSCFGKSYIYHKDVICMELSLRNANTDFNTRLSCRD